MHNSFVTLTYSPQQLPADLSLNVRHWQLFAKRLRKRLGPFRFFHCGEYGEEGLRPHYHALLFGVDFNADRIFFKQSGSSQLFVSPTLDAAWQLGFATIGAVTRQSAEYVARYCLKKATGPQAEGAYTRVSPETGESWRVRPEYVTMSRRPGIGRGWFDSWSNEVYPDDEVVCDGRKFRPPRYYDGLFEQAHPECYSSVKARRRARVAESQECLTPERLAASEAIAEAKVALYTRR